MGEQGSGQETGQGGFDFDRWFNLIVIALAAFVVFRPGGPVVEWVEDRLEERRSRAQIDVLWSALVSEGERLDDGQGEVRLVEFSDYRCPYCAETHPEMTALLTDRPEVGAVLRHLPVTGGSAAEEGARAAICAGEQGHFREMHDHLFGTERWADQGDWELEVRKVGVPDVSRFLDCLHDPKTGRRLERDRELADAIGVTSTPSFVTRAGIARGVRDRRALRELVTAR